ncbi:MAG: hypothetical protein GF311_12810 [Candidatus Lokiarchaeota archaeon]|nr:hypothetical protein [Candidatus Lokiarchaeota archaeon]
MKESDPNNKKDYSNYRHNIDVSRDIIKKFENQRTYYLGIGIAFTTFIIGAIFSQLDTIIERLDNLFKLYLAGALILLVLFTVSNLVYNLVLHQTEIEDSLKKQSYFYRDSYFENNEKEEIDYNPKFFINDIKVLHQYQKNYNKLAVNTRLITLFGFLSFFSICLIGIYYSLDSICYTILNEMCMLNGLTLIRYFTLITHYILLGLLNFFLHFILL